MSRSSLPTITVDIRSPFPQGKGAGGLGLCPLGCGMLIHPDAIAAHYGSDDCPLLVTQFGPITPAGRRQEALRAKWNGTEQVNHCQEDGCEAPSFRAGRCEPHYRANRSHLTRAWYQRAFQADPEHYRAQARRRYAQALDQAHAA